METITYRGYTINQVKDGYEVRLPGGQIIAPSPFRTLDSAQNWVDHEKRAHFLSSQLAREPGRELSGDGTKPPVSEVKS